MMCFHAIGGTLSMSSVGRKKRVFYVFRMRDGIEDVFRKNGIPTRSNLMWCKKYYDKTCA